MNNIPDATRVGDALKSMVQILDRIAAELPDVEICSASCGGIPIKPEIHVYLGIGSIVELYDSPMRIVSRSDPKYTHQKETIIDGVKLFEIMSAEKGNL